MAAGKLTGLLCCILIATLLACQGAPQNCVDATKEKDPERQLALFTRCIEAKGMDDATRGAALADRAGVLGKLGRHEEALADGEEALRLLPNDPIALTNHGLALLALGDAKQARIEFKRALDSGETPIRRNNMGHALLALGRVAEALTEFERALALNPDLPEAIFNKGVARLRLGQNEQAVDDFSKAIALRQLPAQAYDNRGVALMKLKQYQRAIADFEQAIALAPTEAAPYQNLAWLRATCQDASQQDGVAAVALAEKAVALKLIARHLFTLAAAYARAGRFVEAANTQGQALAAMQTERTPSREQVAEITARQAQYRAGKAYTEFK
jgi:tetratricopeptide (TPR) repeat protein